MRLCAEVCRVCGDDEFRKGRIISPHASRRDAYRASVALRPRSAAQHTMSEYADDSVGYRGTGWVGDLEREHRHRICSSRVREGRRMSRQ